jgi:hypothetical protein
LCRDKFGGERKFHDGKESLCHQRTEPRSNGSGDAAVLYLAFPDHMHLVSMPDRMMRVHRKSLKPAMIGPAFIHGHGLRRTVPINGFLEVAARCSLVAMRPQLEIVRITGCPLRDTSTSTGRAP